MALGATIYEATIDVSDIDRGYYGSRTLTIARHPSETESRMMVRVLAYCLYAGDHVEFGRGLSSEGEAALWEIDAAGDIGRWIEIGCPDNKTLRRAAGRSSDVVVLSYDEAKIEPWWQSNKGDFGKLNKLSIRYVTDKDRERLTMMAKRNMQLAATIQDGIVWVADDTQNLEIEVLSLMKRGEPVF